MVPYQANFLLLLRLITRLTFAVAKVTESTPTQTGTHKQCSKLTKKKKKLPLQIIAIILAMLNCVCCCVLSLT